jgi:hypothetical protein
VGLAENIRTRLLQHINNGRLQTLENAVWTEIPLDFIKHAERIRIDQMSQLLGGFDNLSNINPSSIGPNVYNNFVQSQGWRNVAGWPQWLIPPP